MATNILIAVALVLVGLATSLLTGWVPRPLWLTTPRLWMALAAAGTFGGLLAFHALGEGESASEQGEVATDGSGSGTVIPAAERRVEVQAEIGVANATRDDESYESSVAAAIGERIAVQVWYNNREFEDSGRVAESLLGALGDYEHRQWFGSLR